MVRSPIRLGVLVGSALAFVAAPAAAQFNPLGWLFGDPPPRQQQRQLPDRSGTPYPQQQQPPQRRLPPGPPPGSVRQQPLPAPPGYGEPTQLGTPSVTGLPQQRRRLPGQSEPGEETPAPPPPQKVNNPTAVFSGLDKITGRIISFDVAVNETVQFGALQVTPRVCYTRPATETQNTDAFIEVDEVTLQGEVRRIFTGWMFATSPGLNAVEHPIYDVWLSDCKKEAPNVAATSQQPPPTPTSLRR
jgi:hypothetical protein